MKIILTWLLTEASCGVTAGVGGKWKMNVFDRGEMLGEWVIVVSYHSATVFRTCETRISPHSSSVPSSFVDIVVESGLLMSQCCVSHHCIVYIISFLESFIVTCKSSSFLFCVFVVFVRRDPVLCQNS